MLENGSDLTDDPIVGEVPEDVSLRLGRVLGFRDKEI
jgi:hypothetical protein